MDRRLLLTFLVATVFTLVYLKFIAPPPPPPTTASAPATSGTTPPATGSTPATAPAGSAPAVDPSKPPLFPPTPAVAKSVPRFESKSLIVEMTNRGAAITKVLLKEHYKTVTAKERKSTDEADYISLFSEKADYRKSLAMREVVGRWQLDEVYWDVRDEAGDDGVRTCVFSYDAPDGFQFEKRLTFHPDRHWIGVEIGVRSRDVENRLESLEYVLTAAGSFSDVTRGQYTEGPEAAFQRRQGSDPQVTRTYHGSLKPSDQAEGAAAADNINVDWGGAGNLYFCATLLPQPPTLDPDASRADKVWISSPNPNEGEAVQAEYQGRVRIDEGSDPARRAFLGRSFKLYLGPKDQSLFEREGLAVMTPLLEEDFGSWTSLRWINALLLAGLRFFHGLTSNWGVAIIFLTLLVRILVFPITRMQQVSMTRYAQKMSILKPKLDELKERHKNNPQKYAQEQMKLLREHGARPPLVGCLSSFITIPVFVGIFQILRTAIELRQAEFMLWVRDLSLPDSLCAVPGVGIDLNVLPILATAAFLGQMMMQPKPTDAQARQQQKIMLIMPLVFGVMFYGYAAGLSLYMLVSSAWAIFESKVIRKYFFPPLPGTPGAPIVIPARKK